MKPLDRFTGRRQCGCVQLDESNYNSKCKRDLDAQVQPRYGVQLNTSRQARAACGVACLRILPSRLNRLSGSISSPLNLLTGSNAPVGHRTGSEICDGLAGVFGGPTRRLRARDSSPCPIHNPLPVKPGMAAELRGEKLPGRYMAVRRAIKFCDNAKTLIPAWRDALYPAKESVRKLVSESGQALSLLVLRGFTKAQDAINTKKVRQSISGKDTRSGRVVGAAPAIPRQGQNR